MSHGERQLSTAGPTRPSPAAPTRPGLVLALACTAVGMVGLDVAIVNVAVPSIQLDLGGSPSPLQWVVVAYGLLLGGFLLLGGRLADQLGPRVVASGLLGRRSGLALVVVRVWHRLRWSRSRCPIGQTKRPANHRWLG